MLWKHEDFLVFGIMQLLRYFVCCRAWQRIIDEKFCILVVFLLHSFGHTMLRLILGKLTVEHSVWVTLAVLITGLKSNGYLC